MGTSVLRMLVLVGFALAAALPGAASAAEAPATTEQLALMPLPKSHLPAAAESLPLDRQSGVVSNKDAAGEATRMVTAAGLSRLGRLTGFELDYVDNGLAALGKGKGLLGVETSVDLYRDVKAARKGMAFWLADERTFAGLKPSGIRIAYRPATTPRLGQERWSFAGSLTVDGKPPIYSVDVVFRVGALVADVTVTAADPASARAIVLPLARKLEARIHQVLSGKVKGPPVALPGKAKAGPPPNGMDLAAMAIKPADVGGGKIARQGYRLDPDLAPVSAFVRELADTPFPAFEETVELFHSPTEAALTLSLVAARLTVDKKATRGGPKPGPNQVTFAKTTDVAMKAGDEARGLLATVRFGDGTSVNQGVVLVRLGSVLAYVAVATPGNVTIPPRVLTQLALVAATRLDRGLSTTGVA